MFLSLVSRNIFPFFSHLVHYIEIGSDSESLNLLSMGVNKSSFASENLRRAHSAPVQRLDITERIICANPRTLNILDPFEFYTECCILKRDEGDQTVRHPSIDQHILGYMFFITENNQFFFSL